MAASQAIQRQLADAKSGGKTLYIPSRQICVLLCNMEVLMSYTCRIAKYMGYPKVLLYVYPVAPLSPDFIAMFYIRNVVRCCPAVRIGISLVLYPPFNGPGRRRKHGHQRRESAAHRTLMTMETVASVSGKAGAKTGQLRPHSPLVSEELANLLRTEDTVYQASARQLAIQISTCSVLPLATYAGYLNPEFRAHRWPPVSLPARPVLDVQRASRCSLSTLTRANPNATFATTPV